MICGLRWCLWLQCWFVLHSCQLRCRGFHSNSGKVFYYLKFWMWSLSVPLGNIYLRNTIESWYNKGRYFFYLFITQTTYITWMHINSGSLRKRSTKHVFPAILLVGINLFCHTFIYLHLTIIYLASFDLCSSFIEDLHILSIYLTVCLSELSSILTNITFRFVFVDLSFFMKWRSNGPIVFSLLAFVVCGSESDIGFCSCKTEREMIKKINACEQSCR